ncbi:MAG: hypothetical protein KIT36_12545 [Alphaproteobacteria bacterium]|nr:hypothetical protein [Alphaproteobacteria bacterium]
MSIFVVEVGGRPIAAFNAPTIAQARELSDGASFRADLSMRGVWDGKAKVITREAALDERARWRLTRAAAPYEEDGDEMWLTFLEPAIEMGGRY